MRRCSLARHRRPSGVDSHSLATVDSLLIVAILPERAITVQCTSSRRWTATPCTEGDPRYDTVITYSGPAVYEQEQQWQPPFAIFVTPRAELLGRGVPVG